MVRAAPAKGSMCMTKRSKKEKVRKRKRFRSPEAVIDSICDERMKARIETQISEAIKGIQVDVYEEFQSLRKRARKALPLVRDIANGARNAALDRNEHIGRKAIEIALFGGKDKKRK
jgi:hypothetical protein